MTESTPHPWDRRPGETSPAWAAFVVYRDAGAQRSLEDVARALSKSLPLMKRWSGANDWVARAAAWDAHLDAASQAAQLDLRRILAEELIGGDGQHFRDVARQLRAVASAGDVQAMREYLNRTVGTVPKDINIGSRQDVEALVAGFMAVLMRESGDEDLALRVARGLAGELERRSAGR